MCHVGEWHRGNQEKCWSKISAVPDSRTQIHAGGRWVAHLASKPKVWVSRLERQTHSRGNWEEPLACAYWEYVCQGKRVYRRERQDKSRIWGIEGAKRLIRQENFRYDRSRQLIAIGSERAGKNHFRTQNQAIKWAQWNREATSVNSNAWPQS